MENRNSRFITTLYATVVTIAFSLGAREIFDMIVANVEPLSPVGSLIVDLSNNRGQVIANLFTEPSAALDFGPGTVFVGSWTQKR